MALVVSCDFFLGHMNKIAPITGQRCGPTEVRLGGLVSLLPAEERVSQRVRLLHHCEAHLGVNGNSRKPHPCVLCAVSRQLY